MRICQPLSRIDGIMFCMLLAALTFGCASGSSGTYSGTSDQAAATAQGAPGAAAESDFVGVWQGTTLVSCAAFTYLPSRCNAEQIVTITVLQGPDGKYSGRYTCAYGNMDCLGQNDTGKVIDVNITGRRMSVRVLMPDATSCIYTGINVNQTINGGYSCYQGGGLIEQGSWRARRSY